MRIDPNQGSQPLAEKRPGFQPKRGPTPRRRKRRRTVRSGKIRRNFPELMYRRRY